jgi:Zn ribbon nucleic-acid-binding protein
MSRERTNESTERDSVDRDLFELGTECPSCSEPWLRPTQLPGRYRCVYCLVRFQLLAYCPSCGEHSTIVRMSDTDELICVRCGGSMLRPI